MCSTLPRATAISAKGLLNRDKVTPMDEQIREKHPFEVPCKSCGQPVVWFRTKNGKRMPVDARTTRPTDAEHQLDLKRHISHFSTCPQANDWRNPR